MRASYYHGNRTMKVDACVPGRPEAHEVRIEVAYAGVCGTDLHIFQGHMDQRVKTPLVIGHEMSGSVAEVGEGVDGWSAGDRRRRAAARALQRVSRVSGRPQSRLSKPELHRYRQSRRLSGIVDGAGTDTT